MKEEGDLRPIHLMGLLLWRGGLTLTGAAVLFEAARWLLHFFDLPTPLCVGLGLMLAGFALVMGSLIWEQVGDSRREGEQVP